MQKGEIMSQDLSIIIKQSISGSLYCVLAAVPVSFCFSRAFLLSLLIRCRGSSDSVLKLDRAENTLNSVDGILHVDFVQVVVSQHEMSEIVGQLQAEKVRLKLDEVEAYVEDLFWNQYFVLFKELVAFDSPPGDKNYI